MNLHDLARQHGSCKTNAAVAHYIDAYVEQFASRRNQVVKLLEIGVQSGGSVRMWADYFPNAEIHGIDCDDNCLSHQSNRIRIHIGLQEDVRFLSDVVTPFGPYDVVIDDGGHKMDQQWTSLLELWPAVAPGGIYVIEDLHTSYLSEFGGGLHNSNTTVHRLHSLVESLHTRPVSAYLRDRGAKDVELPDILLNALKSVQFYGCLCFLHKSH